MKLFFSDGQLSFTPTFPVLQWNSREDRKATTRTKALVVISYQISRFSSFNCYPNALWILVVGSGNVSDFEDLPDLKQSCNWKRCGSHANELPHQAETESGCHQRRAKPLWSGGLTSEWLAVIFSPQMQTLFLQFFSGKFALPTSNSYSFWQREGLNSQLRTSRLC